MGPFGAQLLGDLGADVTKVETGGGDGSRVMGGGPHPELSGIALNLHRNKRSIGLDLKEPRGRAILLRLLADADVLITNLRPGPLRRLGLDHETLRDDFPRLVYCQAQGFRTSSAEADLPAYDDIIQALTGFPQLNSTGFGAMHFVPSTIADKVAGMFIAQGVLAALVARSVTGEGQRVEVPMFDAALGVQPRRAPVARRGGRRPGGVQPRADGAPRTAPHERRLGGDAAVHGRPLARAVHGRRRGAPAGARVVRRPPRPADPRRRGLRAAGVDPRAQDDRRVGADRRPSSASRCPSSRRCRRSSTRRPTTAACCATASTRWSARSGRSPPRCCSRTPVSTSRRRPHSSASTPRRSSASSGSPTTRSPPCWPTGWRGAAPRRVARVSRAGAGHTVRR